MNELTLDSARALHRKHGLLVVCGTCPKWHEGIAEGRKGCTGKNCGGPISRKDYPEYSGDIKEFKGFCFVCGSEEVLAYAKVRGSERQFGLCKQHLEVVDDYMDVPKGVIPENTVLIFPNTDRVMSQFKDAKHEL